MGSSKTWNGMGWNRMKWNKRNSSSSSVRPYKQPRQCIHSFQNEAMYMKEVTLQCTTIQSCVVHTVCTNFGGYFYSATHKAPGRKTERSYLGLSGIDLLYHSVPLVPLTSLCSLSSSHFILLLQLRSKCLPGVLSINSLWYYTVGTILVQLHRDMSTIFSPFFLVLFVALCLVPSQPCFSIPPCLLSPGVIEMFRA